MSQQDNAYMYEATSYQTFEAQFMKKLSNTETEFQKALLTKNSVYLTTSQNRPQHDNGKLFLLFIEY